MTSDEDVEQFYVHLYSIMNHQMILLSDLIELEEYENNFRYRVQLKFCWGI
jgi:hypothetical protein